MICGYQRSNHQQQYEEEQTGKLPIEKGTKITNGRLHTTET